ncbi:MAG: succinate dehydrogenase, hydrophobic membrane anchor protein [Gammaproteobacteria bacterium]|nr:succinate dehydrogenase, hydrophobic membrane anchor protein [Gammaproteobacteria bacterium]
MSDLRSPLSKVKGLGSAREGTSHFWHQRLTALLLIPLVLWLGFSIASLPLDHATLVDWVQQPLVTVALVLLIMSLFYHAQLGLQTVIEDYISSHSRRTLVLLLSNLFCLLFGIFGVVSVLKISLGA